jgi:bacteriorhodopsin
MSGIVQQAMDHTVTVLSDKGGKFDAEQGGILLSDDYVGLTFFVALNIMLASSVFFFFERDSVPARWRSSMTVAGLVTGIAFWNYTYMRSAWLATHTSPTVYRYCDWFITVPLQIVEFYFILSAGANMGSTLQSMKLLGRLFGYSLMMLLGGYIGEAGLANFLLAWVVGMVFYVLLIQEICLGEAASLKENASPGCVKAFDSIRYIVCIGWLIYPLGYLCGYLSGEAAADWVNGIYNIADLVNKCFFGLAIYAAAKSDMPAADYTKSLLQDA